MKCRTCGTVLAPGALLCGECGTSAIAPAPTLGDTARFDRKAMRRSMAAQAAAAAAASAPTAAVEQAAARAVEEPASETPGLEASGTDESVSPAAYSLAFSTGETVRVIGHGLIGRNPVPRDGEQVEYLVQIVDPERSVSKTHLEFGVDPTGFWVEDRGSANGTRIVEGLDAVELEPGQRVTIYRGLRVELGDQYFDLH